MSEPTDRTETLDDKGAQPPRDAAAGPDDRARPPGPALPPGGGFADVPAGEPLTVPPPARAAADAPPATGPAPTGPAPTGPAPTGPAPNGPGPAGAAPAGAAGGGADRRGAAPTGPAASGPAPGGATAAGAAPEPTRVLPAPGPGATGVYPAHDEPDVPRLLSGRYLLLERIANGGMAAVWRGHDELLARTVAVKILHDHLAADEVFRERFRREAVSAAKLSHPYIVGIFDTGNDGRRVFLVMEYVDGVTLRDIIADLPGGLAPHDAAMIGEKVARALDYSHGRGLVHRDVKPANILLGRDGSVKVGDFGIAKADQADDLTKTGMVLGTAAYVAPEQILARPLDGKADQYALGCVLYEALTGRQPFKGETAVATAAQRLERRTPVIRQVRPDVPPGLERIIAKAMSRQPEQRFATIGDLADALSAFAPGESDRTTAALLAPLVQHALGRRGGPEPELAEQTPVDLEVPDDTGPGYGTATVPQQRRSSATTGTAALRPRGSGLLRWVPLVLGAAVLAVALYLAVRSGVLDGGTQAIETEAPTPPAPTVTAAPPTVPLTIGEDQLSSYDPEGGGDENDSGLPNLVDGDPATSWNTERYSDAAFGSLKDGVGVVVDLGAPTRVEAVEIDSNLAGPDVELRVADEFPSDIGEATVVASVAGSGATFQLRPADPVTARYLVIWLTSIQDSGEASDGGNRFRAELAELRVLGSAG